MDALKTIVDETVAGLKGVVADDQVPTVAKAIEAAVIRGILEGQHRAVDACVGFYGADRDLAHKIASEIRRSNDALIVNLSAMR